MCGIGVVFTHQIDQQMPTRHPSGRPTAHTWDAAARPNGVTETAAAARVAHEATHVAMLGVSDNFPKSVPITARELEVIEIYLATEIARLFDRLHEDPMKEPLKP